MNAEAEFVLTLAWQQGEILRENEREARLPGDYVSLGQL